MSIDYDEFQRSILESKSDTELKLHLDNISLQEIYFGKQPELLEMEYILDQIKKKYPLSKYNPVDNVKDFRQLRTDDLWTKVANNICKLFGFKYGMVTLTRDSSDYMCFTTPMLKSNFKDDILLNDENPNNMKKYTRKQIIDEKLVTVTNNGIKFNSAKFHINIIATMSVGFFYNNDSAIIVGVLLHEIGHNFYDVIVKTPKDSLIYGKANEKVADLFPAMYGYSDKISKFLSDAKRKHYFGISILNKIAHLPVVGPIFFIWFVYWNIIRSIYYNPLSMAIKSIMKIFGLYFIINSLTSVFNPHPNEYSRIKSQIDYYKEELKDEKMPEGLRKEILEELSKTQYILDNYMLDPENPQLIDYLQRYSMIIYIHIYNPVESIINELAEKAASAKNVGQELDNILHKKDK